MYELMAVVRNYYHYSDDEIWDLTPSRLHLDYYFAIKAMKRSAKYTAAYMMGGDEN